MGQKDFGWGVGGQVSKLSVLEAEHYASDNVTNLRGVLEDFRYDDG